MSLVISSGGTHNLGDFRVNQTVHGETYRLDRG